MLQHGIVLMQDIMKFLWQLHIMALLVMHKWLFWKLWFLMSLQLARLLREATRITTLASRQASANVGR